MLLFQHVIRIPFQGLSNGVENDQNSANLQAPELPHKRLSTSSTTSNQSYDSNVEYSVPKNTYNNRNNRMSDVTETDHTTYQPKITNPLFGVNAASHYAPGTVPAPNHEAVNDQTKHYERRDLPNGVRKAPEGQDNDAYKAEDAIDGRKEMIVSANQIAIAESGTATYTTDNNGKINVHVTVMINAGNYMHPYFIRTYLSSTITKCNVNLTVLHSDGFIKVKGDRCAELDLEDAYEASSLWF